MHVKKFLNELDELNDKSTNVLNNFCSEEPQTSNQSWPVNKRAHGLVYFKEPPFTTAPPSAFILLKQKPKHEASMPHHGAIKEEQPADDFLTLPTGKKKTTLLEYPDGEKVYQCQTPETEIEAPTTSQKRCRQKRKKKQQEVKDEEPYIKKPPNAFMLFMKEQRPTIPPELWEQGSGLVNVVLGQKWGSMPTSEKAVYFIEAKRRKQIHQLENPGWTNKVNYGKKRKRERKKKPQETTDSTPQPMKNCERTGTGAEPNGIPGNGLQMGATRFPTGSLHEKLSTMKGMDHTS